MAPLNEPLRTGFGIRRISVEKRRFLNSAFRFLNPPGEFVRPGLRRRRARVPSAAPERMAGRPKLQPSGPAPGSLGNGRFDAAVVGAGIVGLAVARELQRAGGGDRPGNRPRNRSHNRSVVVFEKEDGIARHQTGRNSGVIHSGLYYRPGSLRAKTCRRGVGLLTEFCDRRGVPYSQCGKVIVARGAAERERLAALRRWGEANGVPGLRLLDRAALREIEPRAEGEAALHSPTSGVVRFSEVAAAIRRRFEAAGGTLVTGARVLGVAREPDGGLRVLTAAGEAVCRQLVNCAGLHADRVARLAGDEPGLAVLPFRGEYYRLRADRAGLVRGLIYPVPDPRFPFLGVHLHRGLGGEVGAGPNAILAGAREGYRRRDLDRRDLREMAGYPGLRRLALREWRVGCGEIARSLSKRLFTRQLRRLVPEIAAADLEPAPSGVRAVAVLPDGRIADDFRVLRRENRVHVLNAPSPAATASFAIAERVVRLALE